MRQMLRGMNGPPAVRWKWLRRWYVRMVMAYVLSFWRFVGMVRRAYPRA